MQKAKISGMAGGTGEDPEEPEAVQHADLDARGQRSEEEIGVITYRRAVKLLPPGDVVYSMTESGGWNRRRF